ncbi:hypothetical protein PQ472_04525 [Lacticaseibacillus pabuli]|uniref:MucBP domain-containing protein n=1 Tax=Lacticaseibacillus pabuli TaxID=3025672 RepID=A0ABY7WTR3_9LACO|nr:MucBP domain-containing protein [Lacticaseibacillus sp. KACC 23028]WDF83506.1 hypothetical protein PQ472_04525 [Lacticaseibacillus sp. KACC 23028]
MGLFRTILDLFRPRPAAKQADTAPTTPHEDRADTAMTPSPVVDTPTPKPAKQVTVTIQLRSQVDGHELSTPILITAAADSPLDFQPPRLPGRLFYRAEGLTRRVPNTDTTVTLYYQAIQAAPVTVYHRGPAGELIAPPETLLGTLDLAFTAHALPGRVADVIGDHSQSGVFTTHAQSIRFNYRMAGIETGNLPSAAYIEMTQAKNVYPSPNAPRALDTQIPAGTVWQVFGIVRQQLSHQVWFNLGARQWVSAHGTQPHKTNPFLNAPVAVKPATIHFKSTITPLHQKLTIDGPALGVTVWDAPYGDPQPTRLQNGSTFTPLARHELSDGSVWIALSERTFVDANYVSFS